MNKNRYKDKSEKTVRVNFIPKPLIIFLVLCLFSIALIYSYDFVMQSTYFNVKKVNINGNIRVKSQTIINLAKIEKNHNLLSLNFTLLEKRILSHPWIQKVSLNKSLPSGLSIRVTEETPLAIVKMKNIAEILINSKGKPFKEYKPDLDKLDGLPVITGLELKKSEESLCFKGPLFNSVLKVLNINRFGKIHHINADKNMGISIETEHLNKQITMRLGFYDFHSKAYRVEQITNYFKNHLTNKEICAFDLYDPENVFVKSKDKDALQNLTKGGA
jgi:hypothetical protein